MPGGHPMAPGTHFTWLFTVWKPGNLPLQVCSCNEFWSRHQIGLKFCKKCMFKRHWIHPKLIFVIYFQFFPHMDTLSATSISWTCTLLMQFRFLMLIFFNLVLHCRRSLQSLKSAKVILQEICWRVSLAQWLHLLCYTYGCPSDAHWMPPTLPE